MTKKLVKVFSLFAILVAVMSFVSCKPKSAADAKEKFEAEGYECVVLSGNKLEALMLAFGIEGCEENITAIKGDEVFAGYLFESKAAAKDALEKLKEEADADSELKQSGKWVYSGTEAALKIFE